MAIWPERVSNEGHVSAAFDRDLASSAVEEPLEDVPRRPSRAAAEELAMEDDQRWLEEAARNGSHAAMLELTELGLHGPPGYRRRRRPYRRRPTRKARR
jgi:hypothetical protein